MRLARTISAVAAMLLAAASANAQACTLTLGLGGTMKLSTDGRTISSENPGGAGSLVTIVGPLIGSDTITVEAPTLFEYPAGFNTAGAVAEAAYSGAGLLSSVQRGYATTRGTFQVSSVLGTVLLTVHNRVTANTGFKQGDYKTRTVITCS